MSDKNPNGVRIFPDKADASPLNVKDYAVLIAIIAFVLAAYLPSLGSHPFWDPWEPQYAQVAHQMKEKTDQGQLEYWLKPFYRDNDNWLSKPIFHLWIMNASFRIFGESEFSGRLPEVLMGLFAVLFVYFAVRKLWGRRAGIFSAAALATSPMFFLIARQNIVDMPYVAWQTAAIMSLMLGLYGGKITEGRYVYWFWFFTGWGLLTKGLLCLMFPGVILFAYIIISGDFGVLRRLRILKGMLIFFAVGWPWFLFMMIEYGPLYYLRTFFWYHHFRRYAGDISKPNSTFDLYVKVFVFALFPWSAFLPAIVVRMTADLRDFINARSKEFFLFLSMIMPYIFMSYASTKFNHYIFPALPFAAVLAGVYLDRLIDRLDTNGARLELFFSLLLFGIFAKDIVTDKKTILHLFIYYYDRALDPNVKPWFEFSLAFWTGAVALFSLWLSPYYRGRKFVFAAVEAFFGVAVIGGIITYFVLFNMPEERLGAIIVAAAAASGALCFAMVNFLDRQKGAVAALVVFFAAFVGFLFAVNYKLVLPLADIFSQKPLYEAYLRMSPEREPICEFRPWQERSVSYYLQNRYTYLPSHKMEKKYDDRLKRFFDRPTRVFCILDIGSYDQLKQKVKTLTGKELYIVYRDHPISYLVSTGEPPDMDELINKNLATEPIALQKPINAVFDDKIKLLGCNVTPDSVKKNDSVQVECYFKCLKKIEGDFAVFIHGDSDDGSGRINGDHMPVDGNYPTDKWKPGQIIRDRWTRAIPPSITGGRINFYVGFFRENYRMPVTDGDHNENRVYVGGVEITTG